VGNALALPYPGGAFDVCRAGNVLQHVTDPGQAIGEMARVTRPGGRVGAMEGDLGTMLLDHQDQPATQAVLGAFAAETAQPWIGRQLPRLFREAGLSGVSAEPVAVLGSHGLFRAILGPTVTRLCDEGLLASEQALHWWSWLAGQHASGRFIGGVTFFAVAGTRPR
jgi:SAM-dependent methyltransferase